ncbi:hypothetical protein HF325_004410 [Metschnikowia pulcherrima]|uniref:Uncharacterized protein n=1 Tax=Metschnikowia pulcherrima TaxID=27326 RepID=A0A8H7GQF2_9ASCO|nr:hypothetical protein HF325_004410 [Metschnikowia pulcherrima]
MALRNYLYAKHLSPTQAALINKEPVSTGEMQSCPPEKALVLEDGLKADDGSPKIRVQVENEVDFTDRA